MREKEERRKESKKNREEIGKEIEGATEREKKRGRRRKEEGKRLVNQRFSHGNLTILSYSSRIYLA